MQRSGIERILQTLIFEAGGLVLAVPAYEAAFGRGADQGLVLMVALSVAVMIWTPVHNMLFDRAEYRLTGRPASARPPSLRLIHALSHEITPIAITLPLIMILGQHSLSEALAVNFGLTLLYVVYAYAFYLAYDRLLPLPAAAKA